MKNNTYEGIQDRYHWMASMNRVTQIMVRSKMIMGLIILAVNALVVSSYASDLMEVKVIKASVPTQTPAGSEWDSEIEGKFPDAYVVVYANDKLILKTSVKWNDLNPEWNAIGRFESSYHDDVLEVRLYDADVDWADLAIQLQDKVKIDGNLKRIQQMLTGDDLIMKSTIKIEENNYKERKEITVWMIKREGKGVFLEVRPVK